MGWPRTFFRSFEEKLTDTLSSYSAPKLDLPTTQKAKLDCLRRWGIKINQAEIVFSQQLVLKISHGEVRAIVEQFNNYFVARELPCTLPDMSELVPVVLARITNEIFNRYQAAYTEDSESKTTYDLAKGLFLLALSGHADAATKIGDFLCEKNKNGLAGVYLLIGYLMPEKPDMLNGEKGAMLLLKGDPNFYDHRIAVAILEDIVAQAEPSVALNQSQGRAAQALVVYFLQQAANTTTLDESQLITQASSNALMISTDARQTLPAMALAVFYLRRYHVDLNVVDVLHVLQENYVGVASQWVQSELALSHQKTDSLEVILIHAILEINPNATSLGGNVSLKQRLQEVKSGEVSEKRLAITYGASH